MRRLEVRRHSLTKKGPGRGRGTHLSADGVRFARAVGGGLGPFALVLASTVPRTAETAVAMGFAVDDTVAMPSAYLPGVVERHAQWGWAEPFSVYARLLSQNAEYADLVRAQRERWVRAVESVPDGAAALVVGHGGSIEPALAACLPDADHARWGPAMAHLHGATLTYDGGVFTSVALHRPSWSPAGGDQEVDHVEQQ